MKKEFGITKDGEMAELYFLENPSGLKAAVTDYGATLVQLYVPDRSGTLTDIVLGYDSVTGYEEGGYHFGATVGRVANRIKGAEFELNGKKYTLDKNEGNNMLHGGLPFYHKRVWKVEDYDGSSICLSLDSPDMDQGFPGHLQMKVTYTLTDGKELQIRYEAVSDQDTLFNPVNHSYFNLEGHKAEDVLGQYVTIHADAFVPTDKESIPTGELASVTGTPMDFCKAKQIGAEIETDYEPLVFGQGYDHNWALNGEGYRPAVEMYSDKTGIRMEIKTDLPGVQFYSGNFLTGEPGKDGAYYKKRSGVCFETQYFPDAIHHEAFVSPVLEKNKEFTSVTAYCFGER